MIKLRLVAEHRGRRIVSNGKLYGIQGEFIADRRERMGARHAIDLEALIGTLVRQSVSPARRERPSPRSRGDGDAAP